MSYFTDNKLNEMMKTRRIIFLLLIIAGVLTAKAQSSSLVAYDGGFFVKNDTVWEEMRPNDKHGVWSSYRQTHENENFYYIENKKCNVALPKNKANHIYIMRNNRWERVYNTKEVYNYCPEKNRLFYCYNGGYFVRDNNNWREYRPAKKYSLWASYQQVEEQDYFFIIKNEKNKVAIPKNPTNNIYIMRGNKWQECYRNTTIYDASSLYEFNFYFDEYITSDKQDGMQAGNGSARLSFNRKGNLQISYGNRHYDLKFDNISTLRHKESDTPIGIEFTISGNKKISLIGSELCAIDLDGVCPYTNFCKGDNKNNLRHIIELVRNNYFFIPE